MMTSVTERSNAPARFTAPKNNTDFRELPPQDCVFPPPLFLMTAQTWSATKQDLVGSKHADRT